MPGLPKKSHFKTIAKYGLIQRHNECNFENLIVVALRCCGVVRFALWRCALWRCEVVRCEVVALWRCVNHFNPYFPTLLVMQPLPQWLPDTELSISRVKNSLNPQPYATACCGTILAGEIPGMVLASRK